MINTNTVTISEQLKARRKELGFSLSEAARKAGTSPATLSRYENGWDRFELYTMRKLASALDCEFRIELRPKCGSVKQPVDSVSVVRSLARLFWDRPLKIDDLCNYQVWVVERVLEYGNLDDVHMLQSFMGKKVFLTIVAKAERLSARTKSFWHQILKMEGIPCTKAYCRNTVWNF